ncbi:MAG TPA: hypothetical protein VHD15_10380 [Hyphomicrobiales bacterium]|nr:hypothetical protein [Hyphomicrobiales bacterium]
MPFGEEDFTITDVNLFDGGGFAYATVNFDFEDVLPGEVDVTHTVSVKVRITVPHGATVQGLNQAFFAKAVDQLRRALAKSDGRTAQELLSEAFERAQEELRREEQG